LKLNLPSKFIILLVFLQSLSSCKVGRFIVYNFADIKDHKKFPSRSIEKDSISFQFTEAKVSKIPDSVTVKKEKTSFETYLEDNETVAFLVIRNDTLLYENYWYNYHRSSIVPSFSMAKSVTSILIGIAIEEGLITSVDEPVTAYIPELKDNGFDKVSLEHLLQMTSGLKFNEGYYNPFGTVATFYYGRRLRKAIEKLELENPPGVGFDYTSGEAQLLGLVLERALNGQTVSSYLEEKLWKPLQMEYDASWSIDKKKNGLEKTFCCLNARARDFAKLGRLYLNKGNWNGQQIVSKAWVERSTAVDTTKGSSWEYQYQWWIPTKTGDFMAEGILGQYIYVNPKTNLIIVRLGKSNGNTNFESLFVSMSSYYKTQN
jgi:CubicO group peptidase (beta-lactamase class C family)